MRFYKIILGLCLITSLFVNPSKVIAEPIEIKTEINIKTYAFDIILNRWESKQWDYFDKLVEKESGWKENAQNPKSTAFGIGQFLNSTWKSVGCEKTNDKYEQVSCMIDYIELRYETPQKALSFHKSNNWY